MPTDEGILSGSNIVVTSSDGGTEIGCNVMASSYHRGHPANVPIRPIFVEEQNSAPTEKLFFVRIMQKLNYRYTYFPWAILNSPPPVLIYTRLNQNIMGGIHGHCNLPTKALFGHAEHSRL